MSGVPARLKVAPLPLAWLETVGMRVRLARVGRRWSQDDLARAAGLSRMSLGAIERGEHAGNVLTYGRLAMALGRPLEELLAGFPQADHQESTMQAGTFKR